MRRLRLDDGFLEPSGGGKITPVPLMGRRVIRIERDRPFEMLLRFSPLQMIAILNKGERVVCLGEVLVDR
jgi:hypothetical protein